MKRFVPFLAAGLLSAMAALPANATVLLYQLTGAVTASWRIDTSRAPDDPRPNTTFGYWNVPITVNGVNYDTSAIYFYASYALGGVEADLGLAPDGSGVGPLFSASSLDVPERAQVFSGTTMEPTLLTGEWDFFELADLGLSQGYPPLVYHLSVTEAPTTPGAVPEPGSWALLIAGFGLAGGALRRARRQGVLAA